MSKTAPWRGTAVLYAAMALLILAFAGALTVALGLLAGGLLAGYAVTRFLQGAVERFRTYTAE